MAETVVMKDGCEFESGMAVADRVREKGLGDAPMPQETFVECDCGKKYEKKVLIDKCPHCGMTYVISPCSADSPEYIVPAGIDY